MTPTAAPICLTLFRRPDYTQRVLTALDECYGIDDREILISIDWDQRAERAAEIDQVAKVAHAFKARHASRKTHVFQQSTPLGIDVHKEWLVRLALQTNNDRFIFLEDDTLPARDALHYFDWALQDVCDPITVAACGYNKHDALRADDLGAGFLAHNFTPWGWAMKFATWEKYWQDGQPYRRDVARWFGVNESPNGHFDYWWLRLIHDNEFYCVFPSVARIHNFGREQGEHTVPAHFDQTDYNPIGAWQIADLPDRREWIVA